VSNDTYISAIDALLIINVLNSTGSRPLDTPTEDNAPPPYYDCSADGLHSGGTYTPGTKLGSVTLS
jgi:hypothetical protein